MPCWSCCQILCKPCWFTISYITKVRICQNMPQGFFFLLFFRVSYFLVSVPQTLAYASSSFGRTDSCTGIMLLLCFAVSPSSSKCPWPLWNSINPAQSFPQCESTISHVCYSWHAEQQVLLTTN